MQPTMSSLLQAAWSLLRAPANELGFLVRSSIRWSRGEPALPNESKQALFDFLPPAERADAERRLAGWRHWPEIEELAAHGSRTTLLDAVHRLEGLERLVGARSLPCGADGTIRALDVGCGDFRYAPALAGWLGRQGAAAARRVVLRGIEVDGFGVYRDGHARVDHARAHARLAAAGGAEVRFEVADFARKRWPQQDVVSMFFPFLGVRACLAWGLPLSRLQPTRLLRRAVASVRPGGWLLVVDQTQAERQRLRQLLADQPVTCFAEASFATTLVPWAERTADQTASLWLRHEGMPNERAGR